MLTSLLLALKRLTSIIREYECLKESRKMMIMHVGIFVFYIVGNFLILVEPFNGFCVVMGGMSDFGMYLFFAYLFS